MNRLSRYQRILYLSLTFFVVMLLVALFHEDGIVTAYQFEQELARMKQSNEELRKKNLEIRQEIEDLKTNPWFVEKIAREKLQLVKPGETVYKIVRKAPLPSTYP